MGGVALAAVPIVSAIIAAAGLFLVWRRWRDDALRRGDVLKWADEVIREIQTLCLLCRGGVMSPDEDDTRRRLHDIMFNTSILVERGRLLFKNPDPDRYRPDKEPAYRGYRPDILDWVVVAHEIARDWPSATPERRAKIAKVSERCRKRFVSLAQKEVGRTKVGSLEAGRGGEGRHLEDLLAEME
jgi:hypothetical protein